MYTRAGVSVDGQSLRKTPAEREKAADLRPADVVVVATAMLTGSRDDWSACSC
jgi:hypothetical protein